MRYVVLGGGVAGVSCAEELCRITDPRADTVTLVSPSTVLKVGQHHPRSTLMSLARYSGSSVYAFSSDLDLTETERPGCMAACCTFLYEAEAGKYGPVTAAGDAPSTLDPAASDSPDVHVYTLPPQGVQTVARITKTVDEVEGASRWQHCEASDPETAACP